MKMRTILTAAAFGLAALTGCDSANRLPSGLSKDLTSNDLAVRTKALEVVSQEKDASRQAEDLFAIAMNLTGTKEISLPEEVRLSALKKLVQIDESNQNQNLKEMLTCLSFYAAQYDDKKGLIIKRGADDFIKEPTMKLLVELYASRKEIIESDILESTRGAIFYASIPRYKWESSCLQWDVFKAVFAYLHKHEPQKFMEFCKLITAEELFTSAEINNIGTYCRGGHIYRRKIHSENGQDYYELTDGEYDIYKYCLSLIWDNTVETREDMKRSGEVAAMFACDQFSLAGNKINVKVPCATGPAVGIHILYDVAKKDEDKAIRLGMMFSESDTMDDVDVVITKMLCHFNERFAKAYITRYGNDNNGTEITGKVSRQTKIAQEFAAEQENKKVAEEKDRELQKKMAASISWEKVSDTIRQLGQKTELFRQHYWNENRGTKICWKGKLSSVSKREHQVFHHGGETYTSRSDASVVSVGLNGRDNTTARFLVTDSVEIEMLTNMNKGDEIVFEGTIEWGEIALCGVVIEVSRVKLLQ